MYSNAFQESV